MLFKKFPREKMGLYDPKFEHDACGVSFVVNIKGQKSHSIIENALTILNHLSHRGASGAEKNTGDGAGILMQIPHKFFSKKIKLPEPGNYGVGMVFLPQNPEFNKACKVDLEQIIRAEGQTVLGWREVATDDSSLGESAIACKPCIEQVFIGKNPEIKDDLDFERKLYIIRKKAEHSLRYAQSLDDEANFFYIVTLSSKTICYKGMLTPEQVGLFYPELLDPDMESALALVHSRFSTNTFPSWERSHPYRFITHNGEINTLRGNINWMRARESVMQTNSFGIDVKKLFPILHDDGSDSAIFDNCFEFLVLSGVPMTKAAMMMIPEPWSKHLNMEPSRKSFYEFHSTLLEPWDGPASIAFTDGTSVGAVLDRNGLRPSRYIVTSDDLVILASEVGVLEIPSHKIIKKGRLEPGRMFLVDTKKGQIIPDQEIKSELAKEHPYQSWLNEFQVSLKDLTENKKADYQGFDPEKLLKFEKAFGYTYEEHQLLLAEMVTKKVDPVGSMGNDTPLAVLSDKSQLLYNYFRQLFAQVTNPPIDGIREELVTCTVSYLGTQGNLLEPAPESARLIKLENPLLKIAELNKLVDLNQNGFKSLNIPILFEYKKEGLGLEEALENIFALADQGIQDGKNLFVLSDKDFSEKLAPIPALLAVAGLHHHLVRRGTRNRVSLILATGEARSVHHFSVLLGYGADAICPYLALEVIETMAKNKELENIEPEKAKEIYLKSALKGVLKVISKMGISTIQSYRGAQIFEAVGISQDVIDRYFTGTASRIEGIDLEIMAKEVEKRFSKALAPNEDLDSGGDYKWRFDGEYHTINPEVIYKIQLATRLNDPKIYADYVHLINNTEDHLYSLRDLLDFNFAEKPLPIEDVESVDSIVKRFKTGAMSYGSLAKEVHETIAIAMNRLGGKSNSGEGGEDPERFIPLPNGDSKSSAIKQVASGRFGVTSLYLNNAKEIQIKMAQGAKPGEGGQLPGRKVYPWVAKVRHSTPGVGLISPPPHHDIYSIEDLAQLIFDLKNANRAARINVKLVSEVGVGTIAAGVAKGHADVILISGAEGGTGASPRTSVKHAGLPWELGLAETHQTLLLNNLRSRVVLETDGQLKTGRDIAIAALLGAEEYGFGTMALVTLGCVMMRVCHLDTCPVGITTQNPELRAFFKGKPEYLVNFMRFIAEDLRQIMAQLGFRTIEEMIGRTDKLKQNSKIKHWKAQKVDMAKLLYQPKVPSTYGRFCQITQDHGLDETLDLNVLLELCQPALENGKKVTENLKIKNINRATGTILGSEITKKFKANALPEDTITLNFNGSAGQSFGAFIPEGITLNLEGDANDYFGKGLSGGKLKVYPPMDSLFVPEENIIIGNVAFYGATKGEAYIRGIAGERFGVRNSGVEVVVEGVGDHALEYMTGGKVIILGKVGRNFAAGMSGGTAYVLDEDNSFQANCNKEMVELTQVTDEKEIAFLKEKLENHFENTKSSKAKRILDDFQSYLPKFVKVMPLDYKRVILALEEVLAQGLSGDEAVMAAFEANKNDVKRVDGN
ncbi:MAG: glutamate synthase large subunit [Candidatus Margulisiibacteriota bacterium]|jgi:glutamate synthase (ferredoxin)